MDIRTIITIKLPHALIEALGITEDTPFIVSFDKDSLTIEPIFNEDEIEELEAEDDLWYEEDYEEGYEEGHHDGYMRGYQAGYEASESGSGYNDTYPIDWSEDDELYDDE